VRVTQQPPTQFLVFLGRTASAIKNTRGGESSWKKAFKDMQNILKSFKPVLNQF
jgi:hypothetical protein